MLLLQNIKTPISLRDQHADDVKEDFEERTESEMRTSHEARGSSNIILLMDGSINTHKSKQLEYGSHFYIKDEHHLIGLFHYHRQ